MKLRSVLTIVDKPKHPQTALARTARLIHEIGRDSLDASDSQGAAPGQNAHLAAFCVNPAFATGQLMTAAEQRTAKRALIDGRRAWLASEVARFGELAGARQSVLWTGDIIESVSELLEQMPADLIVKTLHQSRTLIHTPLDWHLLRRVKVPVWLTVPRRHRQTGVVLAAIDPLSTDRAHRRLNRRVMDAAMTVAELEGAAVHVVSAMNINPVLVDLDVVDKRTITRRAREQAEAGLAEILKPWDIPRKRIHLQQHRVGQAVDYEARHLRADLVVLGTFAHPLRQMVGIGNSAERIISRVNCDVLAVPPE